VSITVQEMIAAIIILLVIVLNPAAANAGVVIERRITIGAPGAKSTVISQKLMVEGGKERFAINDQQSIVIDANAGTVTAIDYSGKFFRELAFRTVIGTTLDPNHLTYFAFKSTGKTRELLGFKCRDYYGGVYRGPLVTMTTACFSTNAAGSDEFSHFLKLVIQRLGRRARGLSVPAGVPLIIESTHRGNPSFTLPNVPENELLQFRNRIAKIPPQLTREEVTKIAAENISPEVFNIPAGYTRRGMEPD
jgi:hypothetical protein